jgi:hypothetical protein
MRQGLHIAEKAWRWWLSEFLALLPQAYLKRLVSSRLALLLKPSEAITEIAVMTSEKRLLQETIPYPDAPEEALRRLRDVIDAATRRKRVDVIGVIPERQSLTRPLTLPFAAKAHVDEAVRYQIERVSPLRPTTRFTTSSSWKVAREPTNFASNSPSSPKPRLQNSRNVARNSAFASITSRLKPPMGVLLRRWPSQVSRLRAGRCLLKRRRSWLLLLF